MRGGVGVAVATLVLACALAGGGGCGADDADTDGDGLSDRDELNVYGTSPLLADTDGDGWSDYAEIVDDGFDPESYPYRFNPRVADVPQIQIQFASSPAFAIVFVDSKGSSETFTSSDAVTATASETRTVAQANQVTQSVSTPQTVSQTVAFSTPLSADAGAADAARDAEADAAVDAPIDGPIDAAASPSPAPAPTLRVDTSSVSDTVTPTNTIQTTYTFTDADTRAFAQTLTNADAFGLSHTIAEASGLVKITAVLSNRGNIGFSLPNLLLSATLTTKASKVAPVGNLVMDTPYLRSEPIALAPGQDTGPIVFIRTNLPLPAVRALLEDASALALQLSAYQIDDADGRPYAARLTEVAARTALVAIDYGGVRPAERYYVATDLGRSAMPLSGIAPAALRKPVNGITAGEALSDILRIPFEADASTGLTTVRGVQADRSGSPRWSVRRTRGLGAGATTTTFDPKVETFDFATIGLRAGDVLELVLGGDAATPPATDAAPP